MAEEGVTAQKVKEISAQEAQKAYVTRALYIYLISEEAYLRALGQSSASSMQVLLLLSQWTQKNPSSSYEDMAKYFCHFVDQSKNVLRQVSP